MALFMDIHLMNKGVKLEEISKGHLDAVQQQDKFGVKHHKFYFNEETGTVFCLLEGPDRETCIASHNTEHGQIPNEIIQVDPAEFVNLMGMEGGTTSGGAATHSDGELDLAMRTILFTDLVNSTGMTNTYGDLLSMEYVRKHNEIVRGCLINHGGREVKHTGDGIMASFTLSSKAVRCAVEMQTKFKQVRVELNMPLSVRIGINTGEPVTEGNDFFGVAVQLCKRICDTAQPDQILISDVVKSLCMGKKIIFNDLGEKLFKGFNSPLKIHEVCSVNS